MKNLVLLLFLIFSVSLSAQNISGLYSGTLINDSTKRKQNYELALSEYREKITGYSYTTFVINDTFYYSIKRVRAIKKDGQLVIEDEKMLANNFPESPAKRVRQTNTISLGAADTLKQMMGSWKTNRTKEYYSIYGGVDLKRDNDSSHSALVAHLRELGLLTPEYQQTTTTPTIAVTTQKDKAPKEATVNKPVAQAPHENLKKLKNDSKPAPNAKPSTLAYTDRKKNTPQLFDVTADSLVLSFYDNGVVDGDVISVYVNGNDIISNAKLLEAATKKTIHLPAGTDSVELLLVAETLGSIPPNTGLLVVQDGSARYEVRFSADLQTNAAIVFRKRK